MRRAIFLAFTVLGCARPAATPRPVSQERVLRGHVYDETGLPLPLAHLAFTESDGTMGPRNAVASDGSFSVPWPSSPDRLAEVYVTGGGHYPTSLVLAQEDTSVEVTIKLGTHQPSRDMKPELTLFSEPDPKPHPMTRHGVTGSFYADVKAPDGRYAYAITNALFAPSVESASGLPLHGYELTADGNYRPQVVITGGSARITFDPNTLQGLPASISFARPDSTTAALTAIDLRVTRMLRATINLNHDESLAIRALEESTLRSDLAIIIKATSSSVVRQFAMSAYFHPDIETPTAEEQSWANQLLRDVAPEDRIWKIGSLANVMKAADTTPAHRAYAKAFIAKQPDVGAVASFLLDSLDETEDPAVLNELVAELKKPRFADTWQRGFLEDADLDRPFPPGKEVKFEVKSLAKGKPLTQSDLAGSVFLVDVWATWCGPCIASMPKLHELYARYGGAPTNGHRKRFEILSIALDDDTKLVTKFRENREHPMPWINGIADPKFLDHFVGPNAKGIPFLVLVDETGKVIAASPRLRLEKVPTLLDTALR